MVHYTVIQNDEYCMPLHLLCSCVLCVRRRSSTQADFIGVTNTVLLAISITLFVFVAVGVILPSMVKVLSSKHHVFNIVLAVPLNVIQALKLRSQRRVEAMLVNTGYSTGEGAADAFVNVDLEEEDVNENFDRDLTKDGGGETNVLTTSSAAGGGIFAFNHQSSAASDTNREDELAAALHTLNNKRRSSSTNAAASDVPTGRESSLSSKKKAKVATPRHYRNAKTSSYVIAASLLWPIAVFVSGVVPCTAAVVIE